MNSTNMFGAAINIFECNLLAPSPLTAKPHQYQKVTGNDKAI